MSQNDFLIKSKNIKGKTFPPSYFNLTNFHFTKTIHSFLSIRTNRTFFKP